MTIEFCTLNSLTHQLHLALQKADAYFAAASKDQSITQPQLIVLQLIKKHTKISQRRLVELSGIDRSTIAEIVRRLQNTRQIERHRSRSDARAYEISLTELGQLTLQVGLNAAQISEESLTAALGDRASQLLELLSLIASMPESPRLSRSVAVTRLPSSSIAERPSTAGTLAARRRQRARG